MTSPVPVPVIVMYALLVPCAAAFICVKCRMMRNAANGNTTDRTVVTATILKGLSTWIIVCAALVGTLGAFGQPSVFSVLIIAGLIMGLSGDIAISLSRKPDGHGFLSGIFFFGLGHLCYIAALVIVSGQVLVSAFVFAVIYAIYVIVFLRHRATLGRMFVTVLAYGAIIVYMLSIALTMPFTVFPYGLILLFAGVLFSVSDALLARNSFFASDASAIKREVVLLICYFLAQSLFAVSVFYFA